MSRHAFEFERLNVGRVVPTFWPKRIDPASQSTTMFNLLRITPATSMVQVRVCARTASTGLLATQIYTFQSFSLSSRKADMAKLTLIGRLGRDPLVKTTSTDKEYVV